MWPIPRRSGPTSTSRWRTRPVPLRPRTTGSSTASTRPRPSWPRRATSSRPRPCESQAGDNGDEGPIIRLVNLIIDTAYHMRASDIHIEPMTDRVRVRYRVDGVCIERDSIPKSMQNPLITRFKIMAGIDIAEKRLPQDGRIKLNIAGTDIDFRVSSLPGVPRREHGAAYSAARLRPHRHRVPGLRGGRLPALPEDHQAAQRHLPGDRPDRFGKTTTLYCGPAGTEPARQEDHHRRGPGRVQLHRHQPVPGHARTSA